MSAEICDEHPATNEQSFRELLSAMDLLAKKVMLTHVELERERLADSRDFTIKKSGREVQRIVERVIDEFGLPGEIINAGLCFSFAVRLCEAFAGFELDASTLYEDGNHVWVKYGDLYFDADKPAGVKTRLEIRTARRDSEVTM